MNSTKPTAELINIIRELFYNSNGENTEERDRIIKKVDLQFNECDARIDKYIRTSSKDLTRLIKVFNEIAKKIEQSRASISHSRDALKQCKILLQSKRDDIHRLWLESCEQKCYFDNLTKVKKIQMASENIRILCTQKNYLEAAQLISDCSKMLDNEYREIAGLNEVKRLIDEERIKLEKHLYQELTDQLYTTVSKSILETGTIIPNREASFKRRFRHHLISKESNTSSNEQFDSDGTNNSTNNNIPQLTNEQMIDRLVEAAAKLNSTEANINIIEKMINDINNNMNYQLINMVNATSTHVVESNLIDNSKLIYSRSATSGSRQPIENNPKFLCQLIDLTFEQFKITAKYYRLFVDLAAKSNQSKYTYTIVWQSIQNIMQQLLEEYLDIRNTQMSGSMNQQDLLDRIDINSFFFRKRLINLSFASNTQNESSNTNLNQLNQNNINNNMQPNQQMDDSTTRRIFSFKASSHAMSINNYIREQNKEDLFKTNSNNDELNLNGNHLSNALDGSDQRVFKILVCQPDHRNITTIFSTMEHIVKDISDEIRMLPLSGDSQQQKIESTLDKFLQDFILNKFITNAVEAIKENARIHNETTTGEDKLEISKQLISLTKQRELGLNKPILQNIYLVYQSCVDLFNLIKDMNFYASEFSKAMYSLIEKHSDYCNKIFLSIVSNDQSQQQQPNSAINYVYSMCWVLDEGIKKYFKQLPTFSAVIKGKPSLAAQLAMSSVSKSTNTNLNNLNNQLSSAVLAANVELEQFDIELMSKEVETLISNLNDRELEEVDIITNYNYIEMIAHLHESSDWLLIQLKYIVNSLEQMVKNPKSLNNSLSLGELNRLVKQLDDLNNWRGDTLLLLYLEIRVHCFYHLLNFIKIENNIAYSGDVDTDPDESVISMNRDLHRIYEHLSRSLQEYKVNYVFDALGFMIATIFIKAIKNFKKISSHGIAKMCRNIFNVEQNLSAIRTKSDPHLMRAHRFYELLYKKPEELLNHLIEHEAEFQLNDYVNLLNLIYRSQPGYEINSLSDNIQALTNILKNKNPN